MFNFSHKLIQPGSLKSLRMIQPFQFNPNTTYWVSILAALVMRLHPTRGSPWLIGLDTLSLFFWNTLRHPAVLKWNSEIWQASDIRVECCFERDAADLILIGTNCSVSCPGGSSSSSRWLQSERSWISVLALFQDMLFFFLPVDQKTGSVFTSDVQIPFCL